MKRKRDSSWEYFRVIQKSNSDYSKKNKYGKVVCNACENHLKHEREIQRITLSDDDIVSKLLMVGRPRSMRNHLKKCPHVSLPPNFLVQAQSPMLATPISTSCSTVPALTHTDTGAAAATAPTFLAAGVLNTQDTSGTIGLAMFSTTDAEDNAGEKVPVAAPQDAPNGNLLQNVNDRLHNMTQNINTFSATSSSTGQSNLRAAPQSSTANPLFLDVDLQNNVSNLSGSSNVAEGNEMWKSVNDKLDLMDQKLENLHETMKTLQNSMDLQIKLKRLELAKSRVESTSFMYWDRSVYSEDQHDHSQSSGELAKQILDSFMLGAGFELPDDALYVGDKAFLIDSSEEEDCKNLFRDKIVKQLGLLIGSEPRLEDNGDGKFTLYYS